MKMSEFEEYGWDLKNLKNTMNIQEMLQKIPHYVFRLKKNNFSDEISCHLEPVLSLFCFGLCGILQK